MYDVIQSQIESFSFIFTYTKIYVSNLNLQFVLYIFRILPCNNLLFDDKLHPQNSFFFFIMRFEMVWAVTFVLFLFIFRLKRNCK